MNESVINPVVQFISQLQKTGSLNGTNLANITGVSKATVSRWKNGQKSPHPNTQLIVSDLSYVAMRLSEYYNSEEFRAWLYSCHPQLSGQRAVDLIREGRTEDVIAILERLDGDVYLYLRSNLEEAKAFASYVTSDYYLRWRRLVKLLL